MFRRIALPVIALTTASFGAIIPVQAEKNEPPRDVAIKTLSTRPDTVTGGDVLVRIDVPGTVPLQQVRVSVDGRNVTEAFAPDPVRPRALLGLIDGLKLGENTLEVRARHGDSRPAAKLTLTNHPISGPVFSGPHQQPFICETVGFGLGPALDKDCSIRTQVRYLYRSTKTNTFEPFNPEVPRPGDLAQTTTTEGNTVDFIVRLETGTINRAVYQIAFLHQPGTPLPSPRTTTPGWNGRLVYTFGGGARAGYHQGLYVTGGSTGQPGTSILAEAGIGGVGRPLGDGFAMASSSLNVNNTVGNDVISAETAMMVKERFVEQYGEPRYTIGFGASGGSQQQHLIAHNYPGILDGLLPGSSFPDMLTFLSPLLDCALVDRAFDTSSSEVAWTTEQKAAVIGHRTYQYCTNNFPNWRTRIHATNGCDSSIPKNLIFDPEANPRGTRCTLQDNLVTMFGTDPATGYARRALDNVGVQYGLDAFRSGAITFEQFAGLNERVGGFDINGDIVPNRMVGDPLALAAAYRTGRVNSGAGLNAVPIIDLHTYRDDLGDVHDSRRPLIMRARLIAANGRADNQVRWMDASPGSPELRHTALRVMDEWLANIASDKAAGSAAEKVVRNKPADLIDTCFTESGATLTDPAACAKLYPPQGNPRIAAGGPPTDDVLKCELKPVRRPDYAPPLTDSQSKRLEAIFPAGVCDYRVPGVGQRPVMGTWLRYESQRSAASIH